MKSNIITLALCLATFSGFAQTFGKAVVTGSLNLVSASGSTVQESMNGKYFDLGKQKQTGLSIHPSIGFFVKERLALGGAIGYEFANTKTTNLIFGDERLKRQLFFIGPFLRYYAPVNAQMTFFFQASPRYIIGKEEDSENKASISGGDFRLSPGVSLFPTPKIGIELAFNGLGFNTLKVNSDKDSLDRQDSQFEAGFKLSNLTLGVSFYLGR